MISDALTYLFPGIDFRRDCIIQDDGDGPYIAKWMRAEKQPTMQEIEAAWPAAQAAIAAAALARQQADNEQNAGVVEAKKAYARLQTIIDGADTATTAQLRAAIAEIARDVQHLIRAAT